MHIRKVVNVVGLAMGSVIVPERAVLEEDNVDMIQSTFREKVNFVMDDPRNGLPTAVNSFQALAYVKESMFTPSLAAIVSLGSRPNPPYAHGPFENDATVVVGPSRTRNIKKGIVVLEGMAT